MKTLDHLFNSLALGPLSNLSMADRSIHNKMLSDLGKEQIVANANEGLLRLYSRFLLKERDLLIEQVGHITNYHLKSRFAECTDPQVEDFTYIKDLPAEPFEDDLIKVLAVYNSYGCQLPLNDIEDTRSVFTPQATVLQIPRPIDGAPLSVLYQARHPELTGDPKQEIELPDVLQGALVSYIAYKIYSHINSGDSGAKAQEHLQMYGAICTEVSSSDTASTSLITANTRFEKRGWI